MKAALELVGPLRPERCRRDDERMAVARPRKCFGDDEACLNRLPEPHFVCDEEPTADPVGCCERRLQLKGQKAMIFVPTVRVGDELRTALSAIGLDISDRTKWKWIKQAVLPFGFDLEAELVAAEWQTWIATILIMLNMMGALFPSAMMPL